VTAIKEKTAEVHHGKCLVHRCEVARRAATSRRVCFRVCLLEMHVWRRGLASSRTLPSTSWTSVSRRRRGPSQSC
jgi:hypothetical protein